MSDRVLAHVVDHVAHVKLNRPDKRNGLDLEMFDALVSTGESLAKDPTLRAVVLSGEGKAFCAGLDWMAFLAGGKEASRRLLERDDAKSPANLAQRAAWIWQEVPVPVIAAVHGAAVGGGLQLALAADIRLVTPDVQMSVMEVRYGLVPDMSASQTLLRLVRPDIAAELLFTGRMVGAEEAVEIGLATRKTERALGDALAMAHEIAQRSPDAVRAAKKLLRGAALLDVAASFRLETDLQLGLLETPNQMEAVQATMMKRAPAFSDPS